MTARYYVQGDELFMKNAPGAPADWDAEVFHRRHGYAPEYIRERDSIFRADVVAALRQAGMCESQDREGEG